MRKFFCNTKLPLTLNYEVLTTFISPLVADGGAMWKLNKKAIETLNRW